MKTSIVIVDGAQGYLALDQGVIDRSNLVAIQHPKRPSLFAIVKTRQLPDGMKPTSLLRNVTRKTLDRLITANLA